MAPLPDIPPGILKEREEEYEEELLEFMDPRISARPAERKKKMFNFHEKGEFEQLANKQRAVAKLERLQAEISQAAKSTGISSAVKLAMITPAGKSSDDVPDIEWWDSIVLESDSYDAIPDTSVETRFKDTISELVEHPIKLKPPTDPMTPQYLKVYLTSKERKKIRRQNRKEMQKERTEMIRIGLAKAPAPKVKISNLMRVLGSDAVQDPTKMEAHVRKQMADRLKKHQQANAERKLTDEQKAAKKTKKIAEDTSLAVHVAVYRVKSLLHPAKKFKVEMNAKQLQMTGVILLHKNINLVVVEGGPKQQKFYKNLMLNRIKWEDEVIGQKKDADKDAPGERNSCQLIWEGQVKRRNFRDFSVVTATIEKQARDLLEKHNVAHYWDVAYSTTVLLDGQDATPI
ncbi:pre-mRNA processing factor 3 [Ancylostoma duodenale]|uniref:Pre-mRNA processing factor 3 n=1 Tax=Ancylostoma duodenale TaxID=51022 RepID=A0A0C2CVJ4_9BILA|nr:pre-mRNA processing factor 3 [Ancylostoma duodenale]